MHHRTMGTKEGGLKGARGDYFMNENGVLKTCTALGTAEGSGPFTRFSSMRRSSMSLQGLGLCSMMVG